MDWKGSLNNAIEAAGDMVFITDETPPERGGPLIEYANRAMLAEFGYALGEVLGSAPTFAVGPRTDPTVLAEFRAAMAASSDARGEILVYRADGSTFWSDWRLHKIEDVRGGPTKWISIGRNTDARRRSEDEMLMLRTAIDHADDAVFVYGIRANDEVPRIRYVNPAGLVHSGFSREELAQQPSQLGPLSGDGVVGEVVREMRAGRPMVRRMQLYRKDGSMYWANLSIQPIRDRRGDYSQWVCIERDITELVAREELRSDLLAMIGHDLRNPLTTIVGFSELLLEDLAPDDANYEALNQIRMSARRLESLAAEMLIVSLLERDDYRPDLEPVELGVLVLDVLSYFIDRDRVEVTIAEPVTILADPVGIRHVVENLLSNAVKFSTSRVSANVLVLEGAAILSVRDEGIGIPAQDLPHIFERATRAGNVGTRKGTGLRLSFAKRLVEVAGGTIQLNSVEGLGTTVEVFFLPNLRA